MAEVFLYGAWGFLKFLVYSSSVLTLSISRGVCNRIPASSTPQAVHSAVSLSTNHTIILCEHYTDTQ